MTNGPTKLFGKFRIPADCVDKTAELSGTQIAIIGGVPVHADLQQAAEALLDSLEQKASSRQPKVQALLRALSSDISTAPMTPKQKQRHTYSPTLTTRVVLRQLWDDEREIVELMARLRGLRPEQLTVQDVNLILTEARHVGDLAERYEDEADG
jgi:hypothetical protein